MRRRSTWSHSLAGPSQERRHPIGSPTQSEEQGCGLLVNGPILLAVQRPLEMVQRLISRVRRQGLLSSHGGVPDQLFRSAYRFGHDKVVGQFGGVGTVVRTVHFLQAGQAARSHKRHLGCRRTNGRPDSRPLGRGRRHRSHERG